MISQVYPGHSLARAAEGSPKKVRIATNSIIKKFFFIVLVLYCTRCRFIQVEAAFFWLWWREQDAATRSLARQLVEQGRLEITGGGWSMNDEGAAHYTGIIDNMALGFREFGKMLGN